MEMAESFVPGRSLNQVILRLFLPILTAAGTRVRWTQYLTGGGGLGPSTTVQDLDDEARPPSLADASTLDWPVPIDPEIGEELDRVLGHYMDLGDSAKCGVWSGYSALEIEGEQRVERGESYTTFVSTMASVFSGSHAQPEILQHEGGRISWGARPYPDSLIIASDADIARELSDSSRLDLALLAPTDVVPPSSWD